MTQALHEYHSLRVIRRQPRAPKRNARSIDEEVQKKLACACCLEPPEEKVETPCGHIFCNGPYLSVASAQPWRFSEPSRGALRRLPDPVAAHARLGS